MNAWAKSNGRGFISHWHRHHHHHYSFCDYDHVDLYSCRHLPTCLERWLCSWAAGLLVCPPDAASVIIIVILAIMILSTCIHSWAAGLPAGGRQRLRRGGPTFSLHGPKVMEGVVSVVGIIITIILAIMIISTCIHAIISQLVARGGLLLGCWAAGLPARRRQRLRRGGLTL